jgi:hypothetical protein
LSRIAGNGENGAHEPVQEKVSAVGTEASTEFFESIKIEGFTLARLSSGGCRNTASSG